MDREESKRIADILGEFRAGEPGLAQAFFGRVQDEWNWIPDEAIQAAADHFGTSYFSLQQLLSFNPSFSLEPQGRLVIQVCRGLSCGQGGSADIASEYGRLLGLRPGETTPDHQFSLRNSFCMGRCATGPNVKFNKTCFGNQEPGMAAKMLQGQGSPDQPLLPKLGGEVDKR